MKTADNIKLDIRSLFKELYAKEDLLILLNMVKPLIYGEKAYPFTINQLTWYYNAHSQSKRYIEFTIKKKSGKNRNIHAPVEGLKAIQKCLAYILDCVYEPHESAYGFRAGVSIVDNAAKHIGSKYVYNIDLKDFFPSIDQARIWKCLQINPFYLHKKENKTSIEIGEESSFMVTNKPNDDLLSIIVSNMVVKIEYDGLKFVNGTWKIINHIGKEISYKITVNNLKRDSGKIKIFPNGIKDWINIGEVKELNESDISELFELIKKHQQEIINKIPPTTIANIIAALCCTEMDVERKNESDEWVELKKNVLPQGAPTSPIITNIICKRLDIRLTGLAKRFGLKYSRYADDITFSSEHNVYQKEGDFNKELERIILSQGFNIKESKTRLQKEGHRQEVTGLLVNKKVNVQKRYIKQLRTWIYLLEKYDYAEAHEIFIKHYLNDRGNVKKETVKIENVIMGKLEYLKMVRGENSSVYQVLYKRFMLLLEKYNPVSSPQPQIFRSIKTTNDIKINPINYPEILDSIFEKGLDEALKKINL
jgi:hypothetical protein